MVQAFKQLAAGSADCRLIQICVNGPLQRHPFSIDCKQRLEPVAELFPQIGKQGTQAGSSLLFLTVTPQQIDDLDPA
jgi:hypothetical protein